jgi:hypothetical protein
MSKLVIEVECGEAFRANALVALDALTAERSDGPIKDVLTRLSSAVGRAKYDDDPEETFEELVERLRGLGIVVRAPDESDAKVTPGDLKASTEAK